MCRCKFVGRRMSSKFVAFLVIRIVLGLFVLIIVIVFVCDDVM